MKNPNAAAFLAVTLICVGAFCAWAAPSFSYPTTYPNTVPMTDPGKLQMQNPLVLGIGGEQIAENNKTHAEAYKNARGECLKYWAHEIHHMGSIVRETLFVKLSAIEAEDKQA